MQNPKKDQDQEKGDEVLRRLLKTPPDPKTGKGEKLIEGDGTPTPNQVNQQGTKK